MAEVLQEARGQPRQVLPAGQHAVPGTHQGPAERAGPEQLLPQQRRAGRVSYQRQTGSAVGLLRW